MKKETETTALAVQNTSGVSLQVRGWNEVEQIGIAFAKSQFFGEITPATGAMVAMTCIEEHISPLQFKRRYHIIGGTPSVTTRELVRRFKQLGGKMKLHQVDSEVCDITFIYDGNEIRNKVTLQQFKDNGVAMGSKGMKDNWRKFPGDMLYARCCAPSIRKVCPESDDGLYVAEEQQDIVEDNFKQPKEIAADDVRERIAKMAQAATKGAETKAAEEIDEEMATQVVDSADASVCPIAGKLFGKPWAELDADILQAALNQRSAHPEITDAHVAAIENELMKKGAQ